MVIFQITNNGDNEGLIRVNKFLDGKLTPEECRTVISHSIDLFKKIGEDDGWDIDNLDDFVEFHNLRYKFTIERVFFEDEIEFG
jgi:hypothetical protein